MASRAEKRRDQRRESRNEGSSGRLGWILGGAAVLAAGIVGWNLVSSVFDETARSSIEIQYDTPEELIEMATSIAGWTMISNLLKTLHVPLEEGTEAWPPDGKTP